jgi:hypothetical protein
MPDLSVTLRKALIVGASATAMTMAPASAWADVFDLDYSGADGTSGMLVLTAIPDPGAGSGAFLVTSISGTQNELTGTLIPPAAVPGTDSAPGFQGNDNTIFSGTAATPIFNFYGISFSTSSGSYNLYSTGSQYALIENTPNGPLSGGGFPLTSLTLNPVGAPGPVPGAGLLSLGFLLLAGVKTKARAIAALARRWRAHGWRFQL